MNNIAEDVFTATRNKDYVTDYYLGCGRIVSLESKEDIFLPSPAGIFFWDTLYSNYFSNKPRNIKILELGTGSGFFSIALAAHGFSNIISTDINSKHIEYAKQMWDCSVHNKDNIKIDFRVSDLFEEIEEDDFDVIIFNAPGWGTPNDEYLNSLKHISGSQYYSMFEGDQIVKQSFNKAFGKLKPNASYFVGLNSISGIIGTINSSLRNQDENQDISISSLGFTELPLLLYNKGWLDNKELLLKQFNMWKECRGGFYKTSSVDDSITWIYDVIELKKSPSNL